MKDLTQGSVTRQLIGLSVPIAIGMLFQTLYWLIDLLFVSRLGDAAIAGVSTAGTVTFVILALTQMLGVGTVALVAQAAGRKEQAEANLVFNQSVLLSALCGLATLLAGVLVTGPYLRWIAADAATARLVPPTSTPIPRDLRCSSRWLPWAPRCAAPASCARRCWCRC